MELGKRFLLPGELCVEKKPVQIATLLGSCVAVCLFNKKLKFGGMNHFMLASAREDEIPTGKHGNHSTRLLIKMMLSIDPNIKNIEASVFGGGNVTEALTKGTSIGANNIVTARDVLNEYGINIIRKEVGGSYGRKIYFDNWTGEIETRKIQRSDQARQIDKRKAELSARKIKVLVVDDSPVVRDIIISALENDPEIHVVGGAQNPYEAREMLLEHDPDVICLDVIMPRMDGLTFLKKLFMYKPKPVIVISTVVQEGSKLREQAFKIGAVEVIDKEDLDLYKGGLESIRAMLSAKIKTASTVWLKKKTKEELEKI